MPATPLGTPTKLRAGKVAVLGANSSIGRQIVAAAGSDVVAITRGCANIPPPAISVTVSDYGEIPASVFENCVAIINCVGSTHGKLEELIKINADVARNAAMAAEQCCVPNFVQISSFSVYGNAELINDRTVEIPVDDYGASKLLADRYLLSSSVSEVAILRLPAIVGHGVSSKLERLLALWQKIYVMPVSREARRSMISVEAASEAALKLARSKGPIRGIWRVADPTPVCLHELATNHPGFRYNRLWALTLPDAIVALLRRCSPNTFDRIFGTSVLAEDANSFASLNLTGRLENEIERMIKK